MDDRRIISSKEEACDLLGIEKPPKFVAAPMVRYSKLPFRRLVKIYGCDMIYTPMIYADCFIKSEKCRQVEFQPASGDWPIVQFAAKTPEEFAEAAEMVYGNCQGIDLNCGCPKRDVRSEGFGSKLLDDPQLIADIVRQCAARIPDSEFSISVKIRIQYPLERTIDLCRKMEHAGVSHMAIHCRTVEQRNEAPDYSVIKLVKEAVQIPIYANGNCKSFLDALEISRRTGADGVMAANGLLENPALFGGHPTTPRQCVRDWLNLEERENVPFDYFHHLLVFMLKSSIPKKKRLIFNNLRNSTDVREFLADNYFIDDPN